MLTECGRPDCVLPREPSGYCREHHNEKEREYRVRNPDAYRERMLKFRYGLTLADYERMWDEQDGVCAICRNPEYTKRLAVDHDHTTGHVRALLCHRCNKGIGSFDDQPELMQVALTYLIDHRGPIC